MSKMRFKYENLNTKKFGKMATAAGRREGGQSEIFAVGHTVDHIYILFAKALHYRKKKLDRAFHGPVKKMPMTYHIFLN